MSKCYICDIELNKENETEEHIILNSLGGKLKSKSLICRKCNSKLGNDIDNELSIMLNPIANLLNIDRDRGKPQPFKAYNISSNEEYNILPGGKPERTKPIVVDKIVNGKGTLKITARSNKEARNILKGYNKKYKNIDIDNIISQANYNKTYIDQPLEFRFGIGNDKVYRAICKMAINTYIYVGGEKSDIKHLIPYITGQQVENNYTRLYYKDTEIVQKNEEVLHTLIIKGDSNEGILVAYIELFNVYKYLVLLNYNYTGKDMEYSYIFDVITREEINRRYIFTISKDEIIKNLDDKLDIKNVKKEFDKLQVFTTKYNENKIVNNMLNNAMKNSSNKYNEDEIMSIEMLDEFLEEFFKDFTPYLANRLND